MFPIHAVHLRYKLTTGRVLDTRFIVVFSQPLSAEPRVHTSPDSPDTPKIFASGGGLRRFLPSKNPLFFFAAFGGDFQLHKVS